MLKHCANFPRALEVLLNAYPCVPSCDTWVEAVLPELWQVCPPQGHSSFLGSGEMERKDEPQALSLQDGLPGVSCPPSSSEQPLIPHTSPASLTYARVDITQVSLTQRALRQHLWSGGCRHGRDPALRCGPISRDPCRASGL